MDVLIEKRKRSQKLLNKLVVVGQKTADSVQDIYKLLLSDQKKNLADSKDYSPTVSIYNHVAKISKVTSPGHHDKRPVHETAGTKANVSREKPLCNHSESSPFETLQSLYDEGNECFDSNNNCNNSALVTTGFLDDIHNVSVEAGDDAVFFGDYVNAKDNVDDVTSWDIPNNGTDVCERGFGGDIATGSADGKLICEDDIDVTGEGDDFLIDYFIGGGDNVDDNDDIVTSKFSLKNNGFAQSMPDGPSAMRSYLISDELNRRTPNATSKVKNNSQTPKSHNLDLQVTKDKFLDESTKGEHEPRSPLRILCSDNWASQWRNSFTINNDDNDFQLSDNDLNDSSMLEDRSSSHINVGAEENQMELRKILNSTQEEVEDPDTVETCWYSSRLNDSGNLKKPSRVSNGANRHSKVGKENIRRDAPRSVFKSQKEKLLGYDWIAGILDNRQHHSTTHLSNEHFDKLKSFWKEAQDRRLTDVNQLENFVDDSREPQLIQDILTESKIKSYHVNNRLFSEPMKKKSFLTSESSEVNNSRSSIAESKPTFTSPRYVRITMPKDLLSTKHQVNKAPRKGTCDTTDTLSLGKHCVMGWNNTQHGKLATASSISIKHASGGRAKETLTMEEAENLAAGTSTLFQMENCIQHLSQKPAKHQFFTAASKGKHQKKSSSAKPQMLHHQSELKNCDAHNQETFSPFLQQVTKNDSTSPVVGHSSRHSSGKTSILSTTELLDSTYSLIKHLDQLKAKYEKKKLIRQQQLQGMIL